jgi:hypothetical protein
VKSLEEKGFEILTEFRLKSKISRIEKTIEGMDDCPLSNTHNGFHLIFIQNVIVLSKHSETEFLRIRDFYRQEFSGLRWDNLPFAPESLQYSRKLLLIYNELAQKK